MLTAVVDSDNSVYKALDRDAALLESFTAESRLSRGVSICQKAGLPVAKVNMLPATRLGDLSGFTPPFELE